MVILGSKSTNRTYYTQLENTGRYALIIHDVEKKIEGGVCVVSARIEFDQNMGLPERVSFSVDERFADYVSEQADPFVVALLQIGIHSGKDIEVRGKLDPTLYYGLREYIKITSTWRRKKRTIAIKPKNLAATRRIVDEKVASYNMSGGVDSLYTMWKQLPENEETVDLQVKYGLYEIGYVTRTDREHLYVDHQRDMEEYLKSLGITLITIKSNLYRFIYEGQRWMSISMGPNSLPLLFTPLVSTHFFPSTHAYGNLRDDWVSHPISDHLLGTSTMKVFSNGTAATRYQKFQEILRWNDDFLSILQACNEEEREKSNCNHCTKCLFTMAMIDIMGSAGKAKTFSFPPDKVDLILMGIRSVDLREQFRMMAKDAAKNGQWNWVFYLNFAVLRFQIGYLFHRLFGFDVLPSVTKKLWKLKKKYFRS